MSHEHTNCNDGRTVPTFSAGEVLVGVDVQYDWWTDNRTAITGIAPKCVAIEIR